MSHIARLCPGSEAKASAIACMLHPYVHTREKYPNTRHKERVEDLVLVLHENRVVMWGSQVTNAFIMMHPDLPKKELYATQMMVHII